MGQSPARAADGPAAWRRGVCFPLLLIFLASVGGEEDPGGVDPANGGRGPGKLTARCLPLLQLRAQVALKSGRGRREGS